MPHSPHGTFVYFSNYDILCFNYILLRACKPFSYIIIPITECLVMNEDNLSVCYLFPGEWAVGGLSLSLNDFLQCLSLLLILSPREDINLNHFKYSTYSGPLKSSDSQKPEGE